MNPRCPHCGKEMPGLWLFFNGSEFGDVKTVKCKGCGEMVSVTLTLKPVLEAKIPDKVWIDDCEEVEK